MRRLSGWVRWSLLIVLAIPTPSMLGCAAETTEDADPVGWDGRDRGRWPKERTPLAPCSGPTPVFEAPAVSPPIGLVAFLPAAVLEPVGYDVRIDVEIRKVMTGEIDIGAAGPLMIDAGANATVVAPPVIVAGKTQLVLRLATPGLHKINASLEDGRTGSVEIMAYETQLPVWEMTVDETALTDLVANPGEEREAASVLRVGRQDYPGKVKIHGGSSRYYPKNSFRLDLAPGFALPDGADELILRAEWNDKTLIRNYLGVELLRNTVWIPVFHAEHVHLRINQRYYGVMLHAERVDRDFLRRNELNPAGSLYEADPPHEIAVPGGNLTPLAPRDRYSVVYQHHSGPSPYDDLIDLIERTLTLPDGEFLRVIESKVATDDFLAYVAAMAVIQDHDHIRKNYYLYRDPIGDGRWRVFPWDLDLTFGHLFTDESDTRDETVFTNESIFFGERVAEHDFHNQLISRILAVPAYRGEFLAFVRHIAESALTEEFVAGRIENVLCRATPDILADTKKRSDNQEFLARVDEIKTFVRARKAYIDAQP